MARLSLNCTEGHCRFGISGHGSQFMSTQKLWSRRKNTLVETVPFSKAPKSASAWVSMITLGSEGDNAGSFRTRSQRYRLAPCFVLVKDSMACCQVRVVTPPSVPAR